MPLISSTYPALTSFQYFQDSQCLSVGRLRSCLSWSSHFLVPSMGIDALKEPEMIHYINDQITILSPCYSLNNFSQIHTEPLLVRLQLTIRSRLHSCHCTGGSAWMYSLQSSWLRKLRMPTISTHLYCSGVICFTHSLYMLLMSESVCVNAYQIQSSTFWHRSLVKMHSVRYSSQCYLVRKQWCMRYWMVQLVNLKCSSHSSAKVQGFSNSMPCRLMRVHAEVSRSLLCLMIFSAIIGTVMPAYCCPERYTAWSFSSGNLSQKANKAKIFSDAKVSSSIDSVSLSVFMEKPTPAGPSMNRTLAYLFQLWGFCLKESVVGVKTKGPIEQSQLQRLEHAGPAEILTTRGSLLGLLSEG